MNDFLEPLSSIKPAEVPPFLLTRIRAKIQAGEGEYVSLKMAWVAGVSVLIIITINIILLTSISRKKPDTTKHQYLYSNNLFYTND